MTNLKKWEEVEHKDVRVGDKLKMIVTIKGASPAMTKETYKGTVWHIDPRNKDLYLTDGSEWEDLDPDKGETCTYYRRKAVAKDLNDHLFGTIIKAQRIGHPEIFIHFTKGFYGNTWFHQSGTAYSTVDIEMAFHNFEVLSKGVETKK